MSQRQMTKLELLKMKIDALIKMPILSRKDFTSEKEWITAWATLAETRNMRQDPIRLRQLISTARAPDLKDVGAYEQYRKKRLELERKIEESDHAAYDLSEEMKLISSDARSVDKLIAMMGIDQCQEIYNDLMRLFTEAKNELLPPKEHKAEGIAADDILPLTESVLPDQLDQLTILHAKLSPIVRLLEHSETLTKKIGADVAYGIYTINNACKIKLDAMSNKPVDNNSVAEMKSKDPVVPVEKKREAPKPAIATQKKELTANEKKQAALVALWAKKDSLIARFQTDTNIYQQKLLNLNRDRPKSEAEVYSAMLIWITNEANKGVPAIDDVWRRQFDNKDDEMTRDAWRKVYDDVNERYGAIISKDLILQAKRKVERYKDFIDKSVTPPGKGRNINHYRDLLEWINDQKKASASKIEKAAWDGIYKEETIQALSFVLDTKPVNAPEPKQRTELTLEKAKVLLAQLPVILKKTQKQNLELIGELTKMAENYIDEMAKKISSKMKKIIPELKMTLPEDPGSLAIFVGNHLATVSQIRNEIDWLKRNVNVEVSKISLKIKQIVSEMKKEGGHHDIPEDPEGCFKYIAEHFPAQVAGVSVQWWKDNVNVHNLPISLKAEKIISELEAGLWVENSANPRSKVLVKFSEDPKLRFTSVVDHLEKDLEAKQVDPIHKLFSRDTSFNHAVIKFNKVNKILNKSLRDPDIAPRDRITYYSHLLRREATKKTNLTYRDSGFYDFIDAAVSAIKAFFGNKSEALKRSTRALIEASERKAKAELTKLISAKTSAKVKPQVQQASGVAGAAPSPGDSKREQVATDNSSADKTPKIMQRRKSR